ncbi:hypothetical protein DFJ73DRAFT_816178 [Zopfochytrium polystomum]|nr:hypothetical protein DFJ73DRAFT_816178 [Zopfochytrium polystomum]
MNRSNPPGFRPGSMRPPSQPSSAQKALLQQPGHITELINKLQGALSSQTSLVQALEARQGSKESAAADVELAEARSKLNQIRAMVQEKRDLIEQARRIALQSDPSLGPNIPSLGPNMPPPQLQPPPSGQPMSSPGPSASGYFAPPPASGKPQGRPPLLANKKAAGGAAPVPNGPSIRPASFPPVNINEFNILPQEEWKQLLLDFHNANGNPINRFPNLAGRPLDMYSLFYIVVDLGGYDAISGERMWKQITSRMGITTPVSAPLTLRKHYASYLFRFEKELVPHAATDVVKGKNPDFKAPVPEGPPPAPKTPKAIESSPKATAAASGSGQTVPTPHKGPGRPPKNPNAPPRQGTPQKQQQNSPSRTAPSPAAPISFQVPTPIPGGPPPMSGPPLTVPSTMQAPGPSPMAPTSVPMPSLPGPAGHLGRPRPPNVPGGVPPASLPVAKASPARPPPQSHGRPQGMQNPRPPAPPRRGPGGTPQAPVQPLQSAGKPLQPPLTRPVAAPRQQPLVPPPKKYGGLELSELQARLPKIRRVTKHMLGEFRRNSQFGLSTYKRTRLELLEKGPVDMGSVIMSLKSGQAIHETTALNTLTVLCCDRTTPIILREFPELVKSLVEVLDRSLDVLCGLDCSCKNLVIDKLHTEFFSCSSSRRNPNRRWWSLRLQQLLTRLRVDGSLSRWKSFFRSSRTKTCHCPSLRHSTTLHPLSKAPGVKPPSARSARCRFSETAA